MWFIIYQSSDHLKYCTWETLRCNTFQSSSNLFVIHLEQSNTIAHPLHASPTFKGIVYVRWEIRGVDIGIIWPSWLPIQSLMFFKVSLSLTKPVSGFRFKTGGICFEGAGTTKKLLPRHSLTVPIKSLPPLFIVYKILCTLWPETGCWRVASYHTITLCTHAVEKDISRGAPTELPPAFWLWLEAKV